MHIVHVFIHVKKEAVKEFKKATLENARNSMLEPGVVRFDVCQQQDDPAKFILVEAYRTSEDPARHKKTGHYQKWRDSVADMMAEPRYSVKLTHLFPEDADY